MAARVLLGMLTPSSNTVLEPMTSALLAATPEITAHFGRFRVTRIALDDGALRQFDLDHLAQAAALLADAKVHVIAWNGTSGGWTGFDADRRLRDVIHAGTGVPVTTSTLATAEAMAALGARRFALVSPYTRDVQQRIVANFGCEGFECVAERHLDEGDNFAFSEIDEATLERMVLEVVESGAEAVSIFCTNLRAAHLAERLEAQTGVAVIDSVSVTVWKSLLLAGADPARITGWGRLFACSGAAG